MIMFVAIPILFQGTFSVYEKGSEIVKFVRDHLKPEINWIPFSLKTCDGIILSDENQETSEKTLKDLRLVPGNDTYYIYHLFSNTMS